jgi:hypothetical protein
MIRFRHLLARILSWILHPSIPGQEAPGEAPGPVRRAIPAAISAAIAGIRSLTRTPTDTQNSTQTNTRSNTRSEPGPRRKPRRMSREPSRQSYLWQFIRGVLFAQFVLFATWNNSGYSYVGWVTRAASYTAPMVVVGIALLIAHIVLIRIAFVALGYSGLIGASLLLAALLLVGSRFDLIVLDELSRHVEFWLFNVASIISIGVGWAKYQQRFSGQREVLKSPP